MFFMSASSAPLSFADKAIILLSCSAFSLDSGSSLVMKGARSKTTCAFVPPKPKLFTLANFLALGHGR